jgi:hypothetical protein
MFRPREGGTSRLAMTSGNFWTRRGYWKILDQYSDRLQSCASLEKLKLNTNEVYDVVDTETSSVYQPELPPQIHVTTKI